jgi:hypothetical protein
VYVYRLAAGEFAAVRKMVVVERNAKGGIMYKAIKTLKSVILLTVTVLTLAPVTTYCLSWDIETVVDSESSELRVGNSAIAIDSDGNPHVTYYYTGEDPPHYICVKYIYRTDGTWTEGYWDYFGVWDYDEPPPSYPIYIEIDTDNNPHILYIEHLLTGDVYYKYLEYLYNDGSGWERYTVEEDGYGYGFSYVSDLVLDSTNKPHVTYTFYDGTGKYLVYSYQDTEWTKENIDVLPTGYGFDCKSIALDSSDNPHISYCVRKNSPYDHDLKYTYKDDSTWYFETIDTEGEYCGSSNSIVIDTSDIPHVTYRAGSYLSDIGYATRVAGEWILEITDEELHGYISTALDNNGHPHIAYISVGQLKYGRWDGDDWAIEVIDEDIDQPYEEWYDPFLVLDSDDNPHITYTDSDDLIYAYGFENTPPSSFELAQPPDGTEVPEPVTLDWDDSTDDDGDTITYDIWYATDPSFEPHEEVTELTDSTYTFPEGVLTHGETYYWKVRAWDGWDETWSGPDPYWSFTVEDEVTDISVTRFSAESARTGIKLTWECADAGVGFNLYRSEEATGMRMKSREMLNGKLIVGESPYSYVDAEVSDGVTYNYWLEAIDVGGASENFGPVSCTAGTFVPTAYALYQSRPNPARGTAVIAFDLPENADVTLTIYDLTGRKVTTLVNETLPAGAHERPVSDLAPGVYAYRLEAGEFSAVRKMVIVH